VYQRSSLGVEWQNVLSQLHSDKITKHHTSLTVGLRGTDGNVWRARERGVWEEELYSADMGNASKTKDRKHKLLPIREWVQKWVACQWSVTHPTKPLIVVKVVVNSFVFSVWAKENIVPGPDVLQMVPRAFIVQYSPFTSASHIVCRGEKELPYLGLSVMLKS
jgi:hypothetical protein